MNTRFAVRVAGLATAALFAIGLAAQPVAALTIPSAPQNPTGSVGPKVAQVTLRWSAPADAGGGVATYLYDVATDYNPATQTGTFGALHDMKIKGTHKAVPCAAVYPAVCTYRIYARNSAGTSVASAAVTVPWSVPTNARTIVVTSSNFSDVTLTWLAASNSGGQPVSYDVLNSNNNGASFGTLATNLTARTYSAPASCTNGTTCLYLVIAHNVVGTASKLPGAGRLQVSPNGVAPLTLTKTADDPVTGDATVNLTWTTPTIGMHDGPDQIQSCVGTCTAKDTTWTVSTNIPNGTLAASQACAGGSNSCSYRVRATNSRGGVGPWVYVGIIPTAPFNVSAATGGTSGSVAVTFSGPGTTGPAVATAHYAFLVCATGCATAANWSASTTTVAYPPAAQPFTSDVACPTAGAACTVRVQFVNDTGATSMVSTSATATAAP